MGLDRQDMAAWEAYKVRAIAKGKYRGIKSTQQEVKYAKDELKNRGLALNQKKRERKDPFEDMFGGSFGGFGGIDL